MSDKTKIFLEESQARFQQKTNQKLLSDRRKEKTRRKQRERTYFFVGRVICEHINIIVHYPETPEKQALFDARVAKFHSEYVAQYIEKLNCPAEQKLKLIDAIAQTILENCARESSK